MTRTLPAMAPPARRRQRGFSLIELVVVMAIIAILAGIAVPSYGAYVKRGHRSAAQTEMMNLANREEQFLLSNRSYASKDQLEANGYTLKDEVASKYDWDVELPQAIDPTARPGYTISFTPKEDGAMKGDATLTLDSNGTKTPAEKW